MISLDLVSGDDNIVVRGAYLCRNRFSIRQNQYMQSIEASILTIVHTSTAVPITYSLALFESVMLIGLKVKDES